MGNMQKTLRTLVRSAKNTSNMRKTLASLHKRFVRYSFVDGSCESFEQFQASATRLYHTVEKSLAHDDFRPGAGKANVELLVTTLEQYSLRGFDTSEFFYESALSCLWTYLAKNSECGLEDPALRARLEALPGKSNDKGGAVFVEAPASPELLTYKDLTMQRHSVRHFSDTPVDLDVLREAAELAQHTPSACNRQGWNTRVVADKAKIKAVLSNQNGNRGFGEEIDKLLIITADLRAQQRSRELFQAFIDGGMYAQSMLEALHSVGLASVPLSAALLPDQEKNVKEIAGIDDAEVLILFIGVGNYPEGKTLTTRSERRPANLIVV